MSVCAPGSSDHNFTCFTHDSLKKIAKAYNKTHSGKIRISSGKKELWRDIQDKLNNECGDETCWIGLGFVKNIKDINIKEYTFKPVIPRGRYQWLSTSDINAVLKQYQKLFKGKFKYLGALPIDFAKINRTMKNFNISRELKKGFETVGVVFNLDPHNKKGSHWVSLFIDARGNVVTIDFFDSYGDEPPKEIQNFIKRLQKQLSYKVKVRVNTIRHQRKKSECGMYSLLFIIDRLLGVSFDNFVSNVIRDKIANDMRKVIFRRK